MFPGEGSVSSESDSKKQKRSEEDSFFNRLTAWMDPKLNEQADKYLLAVKTEVSNQIKPVQENLSSVMKEQSKTSQRLDSVVEDQRTVREEWDDFKP